MEERPHLVNVAYRLLGSLSEAEDAVQEAYARWFAMPAAQRDGIANPAAWLTRVAGRICLDLLGSARVRREHYVGSWLPEPLPLDGDGGDLAGRIVADETVTTAFLIVLDSLTPAERVALVLHDVFGYLFGEVAAILARTPAACRQLAASARRRLRDSDVSSPAARDASVVRDFRLAWEAMDIDRLVGLLDPDVTVIADGGGAVSTVARPLVGRAEVARFAAVVPLAGQVFAERSINGRPGLVAMKDGVVVSVLSFDVAGDRVGTSGSCATRPSCAGSTRHRELVPGRHDLTRVVGHHPVDPAAGDHHVTRPAPHPGPRHLERPLVRAGDHPDVPHLLEPGRPAPVELQDRDRGRAGFRSAIRR